MKINWPDIAPAFIRVPVGFHLVYGTQDNVFSWARMLEFRDFLVANNFPAPLVCAVVSVYAQFICGIFYVIGYKVKYAAAVMIFNFIVAIIMVHLKTPYPAAFPAIIMLCSSVFLLVNKVDRLTIEHLLKKQNPPL